MRLTIQSKPFDLLVVVGKYYCPVKDFTDNGFMWRARIKRKYYGEWRQNGDGKRIFYT